MTLPDSPSLPAGIDYTPPLADLPSNRATWRLERDRAAVLVHDMQHYFTRRFTDGSVALTRAVAATRRILDVARCNGVPVFYTAQQGDQDPADRGLQGDLWGPGMHAISEHTDIVTALAPAATDTVLTKHRYSAFARSDFAEQLARVERTQLVITGVYAHIGVAATALEAFQREIHPFVVADAVADLGADEHRRALAQVASCSGIVLLADDVVEQLTDGGDPSSTEWDERFRGALAGLLPAEVIDAFFADPEADWFKLGLDSLRAFDFLDLLTDDGLDIDFGEFTRTPTLSWLRLQAQSVGV